MKYLDSIAVQNLGGLTQFKGTFSDVSVIVGANESGKTSLLQSIRTVFAGGSDTDLLHNGAGKGISNIAFSNGWKATKTIEPQKYSLTVEDPRGGKVTSGAATMVAQWIPKDGFDVSTLLSNLINKPKDLEKFLLENLPLTFDAKEVNAAQGDTSQPIKGTLTLAEFNALRTARYDARTDAGRDKKNLEGTIATLEGQLVDDGENDWNAERDLLSAKIGAQNLERSRIKNEAERLMEARIHEKQIEIEAKIAALRKEFSDFEAEKRKAVAAVVAEQTAEIDTRINELTAEKATAAANALRQTEAAGVRKAIDTERTRLKGYVTLETKLTSAIKNLDTLKAQKLKELPVEGLDIREDEKKNVTITLDNVPLARLNTQNQIFLCVRFLLAAQKAAGCSMKLMICEGAELDESHLVALGEACKDAEVQLIVSMRIDGAELEVLSLQEFADRYLTNGSAA